MPRIYALVSDHSCDLGVDFVNGVAAVAADAYTGYFTGKAGYVVDATKDELTVADKLDGATLRALATEMGLHVAAATTKQWMVHAINTALATATETAYTITYEGGAGSAGVAPTETDKYIGDGFAAKENTFTKEANVFDSWNTVADGSGTKYAPGDIITEKGANITLTAQWKAA